VTILAGKYRLDGILRVPPNPVGVVVFAHGSGSGRHSPRNQFVAEELYQQGLASLLLDLLTEEEAADRSNVFDIELLASRLLLAARWLQRQPDTRELRLGYFGASTGAAAALVAAARRPAIVAAVVSRGGRPDLAGNALLEVMAPTRLIVGGDDVDVFALNEMALARLRGLKDLVVVPGAGHLFSEPGTLEEVARLASEWFLRFLAVGIPVRPTTEVRRFRNRADAAQRLAEALRGRSFRDPLVLGIPRGGVVIGAVLARELGADLDVVLARKLRSPWSHEFAIGAVSESGEVHLNPDVPHAERELREHLADEQRLQLAEIARRQKLFRGDRPPAPVAGRSVIVTDDGIATGSTTLAALQTLRAQAPFELIVAVPVAPLDRLDEIGRHCDEVVCLIRPRDFMAVGEFYDDFTQVEDEEVVRLLREAAAKSQLV
jgi:predicted phosphoribosyltransferase/pimeloyl-ACP methyl ester carboxylesterase